MNFWIAPLMMGAIVGMLALLRIFFAAIDRIDEPHERAAIKAAFRLRFNRSALRNKKTGFPIHFAHRNRKGWSGCAPLHYGRMMEE
jgi:hypothetical protein